ncbi:MAG: DNA cytosine methyltransferase [Hyphomicrobiales bacterium]
MIDLSHRLNAKNNAIGLNVVSLFDGMSCGMLALVAAGVKVQNYFAAEIDKHAMAVAKHNWSDAITHVGDVTKWREWLNENFPIIDLLIGGSPCQDFSMAGRRKGASTDEGFEVTNLATYKKLRAEGITFIGQSYLFWEFVEKLQHFRGVNPNLYFMLENVKMSRKWEDVISEALGVAPVLINSAKVSAQNRERLYWTNIPFDRNIKDRGIMLADILDLEIDQDSIQSESWHSWWEKNKEFQIEKKHSQLANGEEKSICMTARQYASYNGNFVKIYQYPRGNNTGGIIDTKGKAPTMTGSRWENNCKEVLGAREVGRKLDDNGKRADGRNDLKAKQRFELREDHKSNCMTTVAKDSLVAIPKDRITHTPNYLEWENDHGNKHQQQRAFYLNSQKTGTLPACKRGDKMNVVLGENEQQYIIRRFTVAECARLQTVPEAYLQNTDVAKTHLYKMLGNGWTIEVIAIILRGILNPSTNDNHQPQRPHIQQDLFSGATA